MIYDVNSPLFRSFLSQKGGSSDKSCCTAAIATSVIVVTMGVVVATGVLYQHLLSCDWGLLCVCGLFMKTDEQKPKEQKPKASENKPIMTE
ncbi:unnamed protein product [Sphenostylis stenocarpa]|uniref:Uncharacterized protein n=1 Tax=Sphenostylis stenocarpa TaxID=92480 RepID=A0AA86RL91_9FABA|nr:unnamed protein product [Sphenostylis stenocarpa]